MVRTSFEQRVVKSRVEAKDILGVGPAVGEFPIDGPKLFEGVRIRDARQLKAERLEARDEEIRLAGFLDREVADEEAAPRARLDEPLSLEAEKGLPHRGLADAELCGHIGFVNALASWELSNEDRFDDGSSDLISKGEMCEAVEAHGGGW